MINQEELSQADIDAIEHALTQPDIPLDAELLEALKAWADVPSYAERYTRKRIMQSLQRVVVVSSRAAMLAHYQETGERYEFCKGCGKPLLGYFNQCSRYPECIKR